MARDMCGTNSMKTCWNNFDPPDILPLNETANRIVQTHHVLALACLILLYAEFIQDYTVYRRYAKLYKQIELFCIFCNMFNEASRRAAVIVNHRRQVKGCGAGGGV